MSEGADVTLDTAVLADLAAKATPGPWRQTGTKTNLHWYVAAPDCIVHGTFPETREDYTKGTTDRWIADAALIAAAVNFVREDLPALLAEVESLRKVRDLARKVIDRHLTTHVPVPDAFRSGAYPDDSPEAIVLALRAALVSEEGSR